MNAIYKYPLGAKEQEEIEMPVGSKVLCIQMQGARPCIWAIVNKENPVEVRRFLILGTGWDFEYNQNMEYVGTVQQSGLVWHVFEINTK